MVASNLESRIKSYLVSRLGSLLLVTFLYMQIRDPTSDPELERHIFSFTGKKGTKLLVKLFVLVRGLANFTPSVDSSIYHSGV